jgi:hypothetical protein
LLFHLNLSVHTPAPLPARGCNWGCKCRVKKGKSRSRSRRGGVTPRVRGCKVTPLHPPALGYVQRVTCVTNDIHCCVMCSCFILCMREDYSSSWTMAPPSST